ncbi:hypothetical protein G7046_g2212 [Stylonectria norvegica]|nr:hypothetical protein G7046_g2212 [Stylonectria norvegica]
MASQNFTSEPSTYTSTPPSTAPTTTSSTTAPKPPRRRLSAHAEADAARAMEHTNSWTPVIERRCSWSKEDEKHEHHLTKIEEVKTGPGFTERK